MTASPPEPRRAPAPDAGALVGAMESAIATALGDGAGNRALVQILGAVRARAAAMTAAPAPPPAALAAYGVAMAKDLDLLEDLLEALQLFADASSPPPGSP